MVSIVTVTMETNVALSTLLTGMGCIIGLTTGIIIRQETEIGNEIDTMSTKARRQLIVFLIIGTVLTIFRFSINHL